MSQSPEAVDQGSAYQAPEELRFFILDFALKKEGGVGDSTLITELNLLSSSLNLYTNKATDRFIDYAYTLFSRFQSVMPDAQAVAQPAPDGQRHLEVELTGDNGISLQTQLMPVFDQIPDDGERVQMAMFIVHDLARSLRENSHPRRVSRLQKDDVLDRTHSQAGKLMNRIRQVLTAQWDPKPPDILNSSVQKFLRTGTATVGLLALAACAKNPRGAGEPVIHVSGATRSPLQQTLDTVVHKAQTATTVAGPSASALATARAINTLQARQTQAARETPAPKPTKKETPVPTKQDTETPTPKPTKEATPNTCLDESAINRVVAATLVRRGYLPYSFNSVSAEKLATAGSAEQTEYQKAMNKWLNDWISSDARLQAYVKRNGHTPLNWMADDNGPWLMVEGNALITGHFSIAAPDGALMTCAIIVAGEKDATGTLTARTIPLVAGLTNPDGTFTGIAIAIGTNNGPALDHQYVVNVLTQKAQSEDPSIYFLGDMTGPIAKDAWTHTAKDFKRWAMLPYFTPQFQALPDMNTVKQIFGSETVGPYEYTEWLRQELQNGSLSQAWGIFLEGLQGVKAGDGTQLW